ncbi:hypothetical protein MBLNU13_g08503t2 [Cladosporium sp. NU13]
MLGLRTAARASSALPVFRNAAARRFNSSVGAKLEGPADNAFNRERAAVKQHAADTSEERLEVWEEEIGTWSSMSKSKGFMARVLFMTIEEAYMQEDVVQLHIADHWLPTGTCVVIPSIILASVNAYRLWTEHWEHVAHGPALEDKPEYPFQNIRTKNFFWGDGDKTLFWNPKVNYHKKDE